MTTARKNAEAWTRVHEIARPLFQEAAAAANASPAIDILYTSTPLELGIVTPLNALILHYGNHPARGMPPNPDGSIVVEGGCTLWVGQDANGTVSTFLTPFRTALQAPPEPLLSLNSYPVPALLRETYLRHNIATLHSYARATQCNGRPTIGDRTRLRYARERADAIAHPGKALLRLVRLLLAMKSGAWNAGGFLGGHGLP